MGDPIRFVNFDSTCKHTHTLIKSNVFSKNNYQRQLSHVITLDLRVQCLQSSPENFIASF